MKPSGIGGQAVIEGVMMKNKDQYAIAVRKPNNEIVVEKHSFIGIGEKYKILKLPIFRGILAFVESMIIGTKTLTFSASFYEEEETEPTKIEKAVSKIFKDKTEAVVTGITLIISMILAIGIFMITPFFVANLLTNYIQSNLVLTLIEGFIRICIFVGYVAAISQIKDIKRMFMYHGAEHKTINCIENGFTLTVENVRWQSRQHKRCGTSFMFLVMFISILFFIFIRVDTIWLRIIIRLLLVPVIAGVSYEFIRLAGKSNSKVVHILSIPGMWLQALTTKEPDEQMIEVAIQSVEAVFDWEKFLEEDHKKNNGKKETKKINYQKNNTETKNSKSKSSNKKYKQTSRKTKIHADDKEGNSKKNMFDEADEVLRELERVVDEKQNDMKMENKYDIKSNNM